MVDKMEQVVGLVKEMVEVVLVSRGRKKWKAVGERRRSVCWRE
jgi:hypothetical protein